MNNRLKAVVLLLAGLFVLFVVAVVLVVGLVARNKRQEAASLTITAAPVLPEGGSGTLSPLERIAAQGELRVLMDTGTPTWSGTPPMIYTGESGQPDGFEYRLAERIARSLGVEKVKVVHTLYPELAGRLSAGTDTDLIIAGYVPFSDPGLSWSEPYFEFGLCLIVPTRSKIQTVDDLWGKKIGIYPDDAAEAEVRRLVKGYTSLDRIEQGYFDLLLTGKLDAFIYDFPFTGAEIKTFYQRFPQHEGKIRISQYNLTDSTYAVAVRKGEDELLAKVNDTIRTWRAGPEYAADVRSYLSTSGTVESLAAASPKAMSAGSGRNRTVIAGETLSTIAIAEYGKAERWSDIWRANKARLPSPNLIEVGDVLVIPE